MGGRKLHNYTKSSLPFITMANDANEANKGQPGSGASPQQQTTAQPSVDGSLAGSVCPLSATDRLSSRAFSSPTSRLKGSASLLPFHHLLVARDVSGVQQLVNGRVLQGGDTCSFLIHRLSSKAITLHRLVWVQTWRRPFCCVLTRPSLWSAMVHESMKVCAMTDSTASTWSEFCTSKMNCGFLRMLIQKRSGKLVKEGKKTVW